MFTATFWSETLQRAVRTFAQGLLSVFGGNAINVWNADWQNAVGVGLGAALISVLMSLDRSTATGAATTEKSSSVTPIHSDLR